MSENLKAQANADRDIQERDVVIPDLERLSIFCDAVGDDQALKIFRECLRDPTAKFAHWLSDNCTPEVLGQLQESLMSEKI
jgi:hypothetical protein